MTPERAMTVIREMAAYTHTISQALGRVDDPACPNCTPEAVGEALRMAVAALHDVDRRQTEELRAIAEWNRNSLGGH